MILANQTRALTITPVTADSFAPYGTLLVGPVAGLRQDHVVDIENARRNARLNLALVRSEPYGNTLPLQRLERHPHSAQAFLPLDVGDYVVVVAPDADGRPDEEALQAFRVPGKMGVVYRCDAWHAHMSTVSASGTFAMLVHEDGTADDCVFATIAPVGLHTPEQAEETSRSEDVPLAV